MWVQEEIFLGAILGMLAAFPTTAPNRAGRGPSTALIPLVFFGGAAIGLSTGTTIGPILDVRHGARRVPERAVTPEER